MKHEGTSSNLCKDIMISEIVDFANNSGFPIIIHDLGCGKGKIARLLRQRTDLITPFCNIVGVDIWIDNEKKDYDKIYKKDIFEFLNQTSTISRNIRYIAILGDVLEHMSRCNAKRLMKILCRRYDFIIVSVPFLYSQDVIDGNVYEEHLQPDLDLITMSKRYPYLELVTRENDDNTTIAIYRWEK